MKKKAILIIIIIIILSLIAGGIYILSNKNKQSKETENIVDSEESVEDEELKYTLIDMNNTENVKIEGKVKENISVPLLTEKNILGLRIFNIRLVAEKGVTRFTADVENVGQEDFKERPIEIIFKNQDGTEYGRLDGHLVDIKIGETNKIDASTSIDLTNAYDFTIE